MARVKTAEASAATIKIRKKLSKYQRLVRLLHRASKGTRKPLGITLKVIKDLYEGLPWASLRPLWVPKGLRQGEGNEMWIKENSLPFFVSQPVGQPIELEMLQSWHNQIFLDFVHELMEMNV